DDPEIEPGLVRDLGDDVAVLHVDERPGVDTPMEPMGGRVAADDDSGPELVVITLDRHDLALDEGVIARRALPGDRNLDGGTDSKPGCIEDVPGRVQHGDGEHRGKTD